MANIEMLKKVIKESGMTITAIAKKTGILRATLYNRMHGKDFKASEIDALSNVLHLTNEQRDDIFFKSNV